MSVPSKFRCWYLDTNCLIFMKLCMNSLQLEDNRAWSLLLSVIWNTNLAALQNSKAIVVLFSVYFWSSILDTSERALTQKASDCIIVLKNNREIKYLLTEDNTVCSLFKSNINLQHFSCAKARIKAPISNDRNGTSARKQSIQWFPQEL